MRSLARLFGATVLVSTLTAASGAIAKDSDPVNGPGWNAWRNQNLPNLPWAHRTKALWIDAIGAPNPAPAVNLQYENLPLYIPSGDPGGGNSYQLDFGPPATSRGQANEVLYVDPANPLIFLSPWWWFPSRRPAAGGAAVANPGGRMNSVNARLFVNGIRNKAQGDSLSTTEQGLFKSFLAYKRVSVGGAATTFPYSLDDVSYIKVIENTDGVMGGVFSLLSIHGATKVATSVGEAYAACVDNLGIDTHSNGVVSFHAGWKLFVDWSLRRYVKAGDPDNGLFNYQRLYKLRNTACGTNAGNLTAQPAPMHVQVTHFQAAPRTGALMPTTATYYGDRDFVIDKLTFLYNRGDRLTYAPAHLSTVGRNFSKPYVQQAGAAGFPVTQWVARGGPKHSFKDAMTTFQPLTWTKEAP